MILKREIYLEFIKDSSPEIKEKLVNDILTLFQVREREKEKDEMKDVWLMFLMDFRLNASEIFQAHKMALKRELLDDKGNEIECLPMLSTNTTGKILKSYERYKFNDKKLEDGRELLKKILNPPPPEPTPEEKQKQREKLHENILDSIKEFGVCEFAFLVYEDFIKNEDFKDFSSEFPEIYNSEFAKFIAKEKQRNWFYANHEIKKLENLHPTIFSKLKERKCKKSELVPAVFQLTKNKIVENYLNKKNKQC